MEQEQLEKEIAKLSMDNEMIIEKEWKNPTNLIMHYENDDTGSLCSQCRAEELIVNTGASEIQVGYL